MEFISKLAVEDRLLVFSDDEEEKITNELDDFIDNGPHPDEDVSFYRQLDPTNLQNYPKFHGQTQNPIKTICEYDTPFYDLEDQQPELYAPEDRQSVSFDKFEGFEKYIKKFKKILKNFEGSENQLFDAAIYGIMHHRCCDGPIVREKIVEVLGGNFF